MQKNYKIFHAYYHSPVGVLHICASAKGVMSLQYQDTAPSYLPENNVHTSNCYKQLDEYFAGRRYNFDINFDLKGTVFQLRTWHALLSVPYGTTTSYKTLANLTGHMKAYRAVGGACHRNPVSIIIPCHRVIGSDRSIVGYAGGKAKKSWLLSHEQALAAGTSVN